MIKMTFLVGIAISGARPAVPAQGQNEEAEADGSPAARVCPAGRYGRNVERSRRRRRLRHSGSRRVFWFASVLRLGPWKRKMVVTIGFIVWGAAGARPSQLRDGAGDGGRADAAARHCQSSTGQSAAESGLAGQ